MHQPKKGNKCDLLLRRNFHTLALQSFSLINNRCNNNIFVYKFAKLRVTIMILIHKSMSFAFQGKNGILFAIKDKF